MLAYVGLDPRKDIMGEARRRAIDRACSREGKIDAFMGFPPEPQELRARKIGHVVVDSAVDRPWSQYFCCMVVANREFVRKHPVATKRALRAILKATEVCAAEPERAARYSSTAARTQGYDDARRRSRSSPTTGGATFDPEDTVRF